jgi:hypothetical protein
MLILFLKVGGAFLVICGLIFLASLVVWWAELQHRVLDVERKFKSIFANHIRPIRNPRAIYNARIRNRTPELAGLFGGAGHIEGTDAEVIEKLTRNEL